MEKYIIFFVFIFSSIYFLKKNFVYIIPIIFLFYTNINGLLNWEDFAQKGLIKFPDYGLLLSLISIVFILFSYTDGINEKIFKSIYGLPLLVFVFLTYYVILFIYSTSIQGFEWPIKIGRYNFYGISIILFYLVLYNNTIDKYEKLIHILKYITIIFSVLYILYNYFHLNVYSSEPNQIIETELGDIYRNFAATPYFLMYFFGLSLLDFLHRKDNMIKHSLLIILFLIVMASTLTRGLIISATILIIIAYLISPNKIKNLIYITLLALVGYILLLSINYFDTENFKYLMERSLEVTNSGVFETNNIDYRYIEFLNIYNNVIQYNPFLGFGFVNTDILGYKFNIISAGSPDNGITNLLGITGFIGLIFFFTIIINWVYINIKIQKKQINYYAKANFLFICYILLSLTNSSSNTYLQSFGLFLVYDILIYRQSLNYKQ